VTHDDVIREAMVHVVRELPLQDALTGPHKDKFVEAIVKEIDSILKHTATLISKDHVEYGDATRNATSSRLVANIKRDGRAKVRWVVQGCFESKDLDDWTNYAHVATLNSLRSIVFQAKRRRHGLASVDIKTAFLQSTPYHSSERPKYIKLKHPITGEWIYFRLRTPMYGLRSSPRRWEDTLAPWLVSEGFKRGENEPSVFHRSSDDVTIICYVDDLLISSDHKDIEEFLARLRTRFECNEPVFLSVVQPIDFIGIIITLTADSISMSMDEYCTKFLANMDMSVCKPRGTPFDGNIDSSTPLVDSSNASHYRSGVGGIGWLVNTIRPDLAYAFSRLGQHVSTPTESALQSLKHTLRYIQGTKHYSLTLKFDSLDDQLKNTFTFYTDSDHAGNTEYENERRSQSGHIALQNGVPIMWKSKAQTVAAVSSTEAEIYAASIATQDYLYLSYIVSELGISDFPTPFTLQIDNQAAIIFADDHSRVSRLKHIDTRQCWVKQMRDRGTMIPCYVPSADNKADLLTKAHNRPMLMHHISPMMNLNGV
jgi:hypothetical protein